MDNLKEQVYLLGQIYSKLCSVLPNTVASPESFGRACRTPMKEITVLQIKAIQSRCMTNDVKEYIELRFCDIDTECNELFGESVLPIELQGTFQIGYSHAQTNDDLKKLIAKTGLTQQEIGKKLGVAGNTVSRWALGQSKPSAQKQYEIEKLVRDNWK